MFDIAWMLLTGLAIGLLVRYIMSGEAYGALVDMFLGLTGAFAAQWFLTTLASSRTPWNSRLLLVVWGAAALPIFVHKVSKRRPLRRNHDESKSVHRIVPRRERRPQDARPL